MTADSSAVFPVAALFTAHSIDHCPSISSLQALYNIILRGNLLHREYSTQLHRSPTTRISDLRSAGFTLSVVTHSLSDETGPCARSTLFDIAKPDELLEGGLDAYVLLRALERQIDRKVGVHKYEQLLNALAHLVV